MTVPKLVARWLYNIRQLVTRQSHSVSLRSSSTELPQIPGSFRRLLSIIALRFNMNSMMNRVRLMGIGREAAAMSAAQVSKAKKPLAPAPSPVYTPVAALSSSAEVSFQTKSYKLHRLDTGPSTDVTLTRDDALAYYKQMQMIRRMETTAANLYKEKQIRGFCHLYSGQEAIAVGMVAAMNGADQVTTAYRCHGWAFVLGTPVREVLGELTARVTGNVFGKGGSMHMYNKRFFGGNGIVGAQVPLGCGVGLYNQYSGNGLVSYALFGDGAANQGQIFEAMNMAKLWKLPVVLICENNGYGMGTSVERASASTEYYTRGDYVPGIWVDAMDVLAVREATRFAREYALEHGPIMLDLATYRYHGHSMSDPGTSYRTRDEIQEVRKTRDPITGFRDKIITANLVTNDEMKKIDSTVRQDIKTIHDQVMADPQPPMELLATDVYMNTPPFEIRGATIDHPLKQQWTNSREALKALNITAR